MPFSSQHPNYFGNICIFVGLVFMNLQVLSSSWWRLLGGFMAPTFMVCLFYAQSTSMVADAVAIATQKYGKPYEDWMKATPMILPNFKLYKR